MSAGQTGQVTGLVQDLADVDAAGTAVVGGKAANLGELLRAGLPVPPGFVVPTAAYRRVTGPAALPELSDVLKALDAETDPARLAALAGRARELVRAAPVPPELAAAITDAYSRLGDDVPVAVRSSATAEDLPQASFAGQQDTFLGVVGAEALLDAVRRCWASLWTDRAVTYRAIHGIDSGDVALAVVVQRLVDADAAGVMFTANPVTGRRREVVIEAGAGLGESVVSGGVNPDRFVVDRTGAVTERRLGDQRSVVRRASGGGTERAERTRADGAAWLTDTAVTALAALGRRTENHYGAPQDTEWALDGDGRLWLTQARPITTLYPLPNGRPPDDGGTAWFCISLAQGLVRPITPMGLSAFRLMGSGLSRLFGTEVDDPLAGPPQLVVAGQRPFVDVTGALRSPVGRRLFPRVLDVMEARSAVVLRSLADDPEFTPTTRSWIPFGHRVSHILRPYRVPLRVAEGLVRPQAARERVQRFERELLAQLVVPPDATADQRLDDVQLLLTTVVPTVLPTVGPIALVPGFGMLALGARLARPDLRPGDLATVLRALPHNVTTEMDLELWDLSRRLRADDSASSALSQVPTPVLLDRYRTGTLPAALQHGLAAFLQRWGDRAVAEIDVGVPRWSDDPSHVLDVLAGYLRLDVDTAPAPDEQFRRGAQAATDTVQRLARDASRRGRWRGVLVGFALRRARSMAGLRETPKFLLVRLFGHVRRQLRLVGEDLVLAGVLDDADDVFFLTLAEARAAVRSPRDLRPVVAARHEDYARELRRRHVPRVVLSDGTEPEAVAAAAAGSAAGDGGGLRGTPASPGTVTGPARVVLDPAGARLSPGDVLVAPSTDPGWTPLFLTAGGLVMEMGGANSHGAVVAREYGIPAVVGVPDATHVLQDGDTVTVDGAAGTVTPAG